MDPKLLCPTLTIMLTKTIKALCEVNIKFDKKLEISGSLHVRSDGEKILTCLIDEDSTRTVSGGTIQQRSTPETALAQQSAVMALLTASQQMAANRSPGLISPHARNSTPGDGGSGGGGHHNITTNNNNKTTQQLQHSLHNSTQEQYHQHGYVHQHPHHHPHPHHQYPPHLHHHPGTMVHGSHHNMLLMSPPGGVMMSEQDQQHPGGLPPVNSFIQNKHERNDREVLLGMLQDKSKKLTEPSTTQHYPIQVHVKKEPLDPQAVHHLLLTTSTTGAPPHLTPVSSASSSAHVLQVVAPQLSPAVSLAAVTASHQQHSTTNTTTSNNINTQTTAIVNGTTSAIHPVPLPPLAGLPSFPMLVGSAAWPAQIAPTITVPATTGAGSGDGGGVTPPAIISSVITKSDPDSPPRENEYVTTINSKGQKKFQCMFCGILLSTKNYLKNHINAVHTKARVYPCEICERYFYSAGALRIHKLRHHWAGSKKHKCHHCHDTFLLPVELRRHLVKKHGDTTGGHSEDENGEGGGGVVLTAGGGGGNGGGGGGGGKGKNDGSGGLTIQQIHQLQLREQLRAQQHLYEQEQAIHNLQRHISDQNSPIELCGRSDSVSEEREPGEVLNDEMNSHMTIVSCVPLTAHELASCPVSLIAETSNDQITDNVAPPPPKLQASTQSEVVVEPEAPPDDITGEDMDTEIHPNQNEVGIPDDEDDEIHEIHEVTLEEIDEIKGKNRVQVEYMAQSQTVGDGGD